MPSSVPKYKVETLYLHKYHDLSDLYRNKIIETSSYRRLKKSAFEFS